MATAIATVDDIKALGSISSSNSDAVLSLILGSAVLALGNYCNRDFTSSNRVEMRDGNDSSRMLMVGYPITAINSLVISNVAIPLSVNGQPGYLFSGRAVYLVGYVFTRGIRNVQISYTGGYGDAGGLAPWPSDLKYAVMMYVLTRYKERERLGVGSKSLASESVGYSDISSISADGLPAAARTILQNYMNIVPESGQ